MCICLLVCLFFDNTVESKMPNKFRPFLVFLLLFFFSVTFASFRLSFFCYLLFLYEYLYLLSPRLVFLLILHIWFCDMAVCCFLCFLFIPSSWLFFSSIFLLLVINCSPASYLCLAFIFFEILNCYDSISGRKKDLPGLVKAGFLFLFACRP